MNKQICEHGNHFRDVSELLVCVTCGKLICNSCKKQETDVRHKRICVIQHHNKIYNCAIIYTLVYPGQMSDVTINQRLNSHGVKRISELQVVLAIKKGAKDIRAKYLKTYE